MKNTKLITGIISCVLFMLIAFQSCAAGVADSLENSGGVSGGAGILVGIFMLAAGITSIASHKKVSGGGTIAGIILYALAAVIGFTQHGIFEDLMVWGGVSLAFAAVLLIFQIKGKKDESGSEGK